MTRPPGAGRAAVFLDRDGVVNEAVVVDGRPHPPAAAEGLVLTPGVAEACQRMREAGLLLIVVTNQPDIARGTCEATEVEALHRELLRRVDLDDILTCPHDDADGCDCRKPAPGLLREAARTWGIDLGRSVMVGDRWRDIEAGRRAGCATVLVDRGYDEPVPREPDLIVQELHAAVPWILETTGGVREQ